MTEKYMPEVLYPIYKPIRLCPGDTKEYLVLLGIELSEKSLCRAKLEFDTEDQVLSLFMRHS